MIKPKLKLSYSRVNTYLSCSKKYDLYYNHRLRENAVPSSFFFGSAIDVALGRILLDKKVDLTDKEKEILEDVNSTAEALYCSAMNEYKLNGEVIDLAKDSRARFFKNDFDVQMVPEADLERMEHVWDRIKNKQTVDKEDYSYYQSMTWLSLFRKGFEFLNEYRQTIYPQISKVYSLQRHISILNDSKDEFIGFIDAEVEFVNEPGVRYTIDHKTSSVAYIKDSAAKSDQLAAYDEVANNGNVAFIVIEKQLRKKDPKVRINIIKSKTLETTKENIFIKIDSALNGINTEVYEPNWNSCFSFGQKCAYYDTCRSGKIDHLIKLEK